MFTSTEYRVIKVLVNDRLESIKKKIKDQFNKNIVGLDTLIKKIDCILNYTLGYDYSISEQKIEKIDWVMKASQDLAERYSKLKDMSQTFEYDRMKKECGTLLFMLGDLKAEFDTNKDFAKSDLKVLFYKISEEYRKEEGKMSTTMADRKAEIDNRYILAKEEYRLYLQYTNIIKTRYDVLKDMHQSMVQSVSTARVGMIQESYTDNGNGNSRN